MLQLIKNELFKVVKQRKLLFFMGALLFIALIFAAVANYTDEIPGDISGQVYPLLLLDAVTGILPVLLLFLVADLTTQEYLSGTLKLPLLYPVSRQILLLSKMVTLLLISILLLLFVLLTGYVVGTIVFGWGHYVGLDNLSLPLWEGVRVNLQSYALSVLPLYSLSLLFFLVSLQQKSIGAAIGASLGIFFLLTISGDLVAVIRPYSLATYLPFYMFFLTGASFADIVFGFFIIGIYGALAIALSLHFFNRKDLLH